MRALLVVACAALAGAAPAAETARIEGGAYPLGYTPGVDETRPGVDPESLARAARGARPAHTVVLAAFEIDRHEVTNAEFAAFLSTLDARPIRDRAPGTVRPADLEGPDASRLWEADGERALAAWVALDDAQSRIGAREGRFDVEAGYEQHPVNEVTWAGAAAYCRWRNARLPTEAEWEAAARGREGRLWPWGDAPPTHERAVFARGSNATAPVGARPLGATPDGVHDLAGNVAEWTSTLYAPYPYDAGDGREDPQARGERVTRGGDHVFDSAPWQLTGFFRAGFSRAVDKGHRHIGFRCARSLAGG